MQISSRRLRVFLQVEGPKFFVCRDSIQFHVDIVDGLS